MGCCCWSSVQLPAFVPLGTLNWFMSVWSGFWWFRHHLRWEQWPPVVYQFPGCGKVPHVSRWVLLSKVLVQYLNWEGFLCSVTNSSIFIRAFCVKKQLNALNVQITKKNLHSPGDFPRDLFTLLVIVGIRHSHSVHTVHIPSFCLKCICYRLPKINLRMLGFRFDK